MNDDFYNLNGPFKICGKVRIKQVLIFLKKLKLATYVYAF